MSLSVALAVLVWCVLLAMPTRTEADDKPEPVKRRAAALTKADADWVNKAEGKMTEDELLTRFGPADEFKSPGKLPADYAMIWRDRTVIRVKFDKDDAVEYTGWFCDRLADKKATPEAFKKLKKGMSSFEVGEVLGVSSYEGKECQYWGSHRTLTVYIKSGKVAAYGWGENSTDGWD